MDFELSPEQKEIQALARDFVRAEIEPHAAEWDREHRFPREVYAKLAELGLMGVCIPEEYGGAGADFLSYMLVIEELSRGDAGVGVTVAVHTSAVTLPLLRFGTDEQRARFVPPLARGELIGAFALTEAEAGSDAGSLRTSATREDGGWRISGAKQFISTAEVAGTFLLFARTDPDTPGARGVSAFVLDSDHIRVTGREEKLGLNSSTTNSIAVDAHVDADRLLHEEGKGFHVAMATLDGGRIGIAAQAVGIAQAAYDVAREYAKERHAFGRPIADFQAIQHKLADMSTEIDAARLLVHRAAWLKQNDQPHTEAGAKAKLFASEMARRQTGEAIQILGGYGYTKEFPVERYYRDAKITEIYEGTSEIQRLVIARSILGLQERSLAAGLRVLEDGLAVRDEQTLDRQLHDALERCLELAGTLERGALADPQLAVDVDREDLGYDEGGMRSDEVRDLPLVRAFDRDLVDGLRRRAADSSVVTHRELVGAAAMPLRREEDHDGMRAPRDVGVEVAEELGLLTCGNERVDEHGRVRCLVVDAADLAGLALAAGPVLPVRVRRRPAPEALG